MSSVGFIVEFFSLGATENQQDVSSLLYLFRCSQDAEEMHKKRLLFMPFENG